jgi:hypothetical protein
VVIVDNLDRIDNRPKGMGRSQQEYLFIDQHECLRKLHCHKVYTMPLALKFSSEYGLLTARYMDDPKVLPMVPVKLRDGHVCEEGHGAAAADGAGPGHARTGGIGAVGLHC